MNLGLCVGSHHRPTREASIVHNKHESLYDQDHDGFGGWRRRGGGEGGLYDAEGLSIVSDLRMAFVWLLLD